MNSFILPRPGAALEPSSLHEPISNNLQRKSVLSGDTIENAWVYDSQMSQNTSQQIPTPPQLPPSCNAALNYVSSTKLPSVPSCEPTKAPLSPGTKARIEANKQAALQKRAARLAEEQKRSNIRQLELPQPRAPALAYHHNAPTPMTLSQIAPRNNNMQDNVMGGVFLQTGRGSKIDVSSEGLHAAHNFLNSIPTLSSVQMPHVPNSQSNSNVGDANMTYQPARSMPPSSKSAISIMPRSVD